MRLITWNINSVRLRVGLVRRLLEEQQPDILCLQETKTPDELFPRAEFEALGYRHMLVHGMKGYNGVAIVSRVPFATATTRSWCARADCRHAVVELPGGIELHNIYVPAGGDIPDPDANAKFGTYILHSLNLLKLAGQAGVLGLLLVSSPPAAYGLAPTHTWMTPASHAAGFVMCMSLVKIPSFRNAHISIAAAANNLGSFGSYRTQTAIIVLSPTRIVPSPRLNVGFPSAGACSCHPPATIAPSISPRSLIGSISTCIDISNDVSENGLTKIATNCICSGVNSRGASLFSRAMILDCCKLLTPSSKANSDTVQTDSTATPTMTSHFATRWTAAEYAGDSKIMPAPTAIPASTLSDRSATWGQNGWASPERTVLKYVSIAAILAWLFAAGAAFFRLFKAARHLWRERYQLRDGS